MFVKLKSVLYVWFYVRLARYDPMVDWLDNLKLKLLILQLDKLEL